MLARVDYPRITNIKISIRLNEKEQTHALLRNVRACREYLRSHGNFYILRHRFVYVIFPASGFVNITKIKSVQEIQQSIIHFMRCLRLPYSRLPFPKIDNICCIGQIHAPIYLQSLDTFSKIPQIYQRYLIRTFCALDTFPRLYVRTSFGTIHVYKSGRYLFLASKHPKYVTCQFHLLKKLVQSCFNTV